MKPILIASASLVAAGAAFGFAKAVDHMTRNPDLRAPSAAIAVERIVPPAYDPFAAPAAQSSAAFAPVPVAPTIAPEAEIAEIATVPVAPQPVADQTTARSADILPGVTRGNADSSPSMSFLPAGTLLPDDAQGSTRYEFGALPLIGVYR